MKQRHYTIFDHLAINLDQSLRTLFGKPLVTERANPALDEPEPLLTENERKHVASLIRIDHSGEVCAQALYQGQALTAKLSDVRNQMQRAADEENDHLAWCATRLQELHSHKSVLNPLWYLGSLAIGALAGAIGDKWSLGFVAETEKQVVKHLDDHLQRLPEQDIKSKKILARMRADEEKHATHALVAGGAELPTPVKKLMGVLSKVMTTTVYWI